MRPALRRVLLQQPLHAEIGLADPAARIDARSKQEREVPGSGWPKPRHIHQRRGAGVFAPAQRDQAFGDEGAVKALQRHDIGNSPSATR